MQIVGGVAGELAAAPFVAKTYRMVNDPVTDGVITWGRENNSFVVVEPFAFSQTLLPSYFKHGNFSSFVRQLNTYGFRKVDPDRWEFAHAFFLRGQTNLLRQIVRRKKGRGEEKEDETATTEAATEVVILKREQMAFGKRADQVWLRLQEAERKQRRLLTFLGKLVGGDPQLMGRLIAKAGVSDGEGVEWEKRARLRRDGGQLPGKEAGENVEFFGLDGFGMGINGEEAGFGSIEMDPFYAYNTF